MLTKIYLATCDACGREAIVKAFKAGDARAMLWVRGWHPAHADHPHRRLDYCPACFEAIRRRVVQAPSSAWYGK